MSDNPSEWAQAEARKLVANWWGVWNREGCVNQIARALDRAAERAHPPKDDKPT